MLNYQRVTSSKSHIDSSKDKVTACTKKTALKKSSWNPEKCPLLNHLKPRCFFFVDSPLVKSPFCPYLSIIFHVFFLTVRSPFSQASITMVYHLSDPKKKRPAPAAVSRAPAETRTRKMDKAMLVWTWMVSHDGSMVLVEKCDHMTGVYWWDPWHTIYSSTMDPMGMDELDEKGGLKSSN